jgi:16S rRNA (guanine527-N7)-methyltransferase
MIHVKHPGSELSATDARYDEAMSDDLTSEKTAGAQQVHAVFDWVDYRGERDQVVKLLATYRDWLATEALMAGGIGPAEVGRLWHRHIADSLTFLAGLSGQATVLDVGTGVGLPGIPLAIALPRVSFTLLDRSERRCDLASRALRVLELTNVEVIQGAVERLSLPHEAAVSRAFAAPASLAPILRRLLPGGTVAVLAGSHGEVEPTGPGNFETIRIPKHVLGESAWLAKVSLSS